MIEPISAALSAIGGFGAAAITNWFDLQRTRENNKHAKEMHDRGLVEYQMKASDEEHKRLVAHDQAISGLDKLSASVRPVLTYSIVGISLALAICGVAGYIPGFNTLLALNFVFNAASAILCYWFGSRNFEKQRRIWFK